MSRGSEQTFFQRRHTDGQQAHEKILHIIKHQGNTKSKPQWDITSHLSEWLSSKKAKITSAGKNMEKRERLCTVGGNVNWCSHYENSMQENSMEVPQKIKNISTRGFLVAQWLRICLLMQETRVRALVWEDPTCRGATRPVSHNYWACASGACAPQQERPQ